MLRVGLLFTKYIRDICLDERSRKSESITSNMWCAEQSQNTTSDIKLILLIDNEHYSMGLYIDPDLFRPSKYSSLVLQLLGSIINHHN